MPTTLLRTHVHRAINKKLPGVSAMRRYCGGKSIAGATATPIGITPRGETGT